MRLPSSLTTSGLRSVAVIDISVLYLSLCAVVTFSSTSDDVSTAVVVESLRVASARRLVVGTVAMHLWVLSAFQVHVSVPVRAAAHLHLSAPPNKLEIFPHTTSPNALPSMSSKALRRVAFDLTSVGTNTLTVVEVSSFLFGVVSGAVVALVVLPVVVLLLDATVVAEAATVVAEAATVVAATVVAASVAFPEDLTVVAGTVVAGTVVATELLLLLVLPPPELAVLLLLALAPPLALVLLPLALALALLAA